MRDSPSRRHAGRVLEHQRSAQRRHEKRLSVASQLMFCSDVLCLQETHGTHEYLQALAVIFLSGWILVGTFLADKKNAGGCAVLVRKSFPSCKEVSNMWSCVMVKITWSLLRTGHGSCTIFLKPRLTQRELRKRLVRIHVE